MFQIAKGPGGSANSKRTTVCLISGNIIDASADDEWMNGHFQGQMYTVRRLVT
jgi:hypothetical protein